MPHLKLYLFGTPRLETDGQLCNISLRKGQALLVYLAVTHQPHSRDTLATLFWPRADQRTARTNLRRLIYDTGQRVEGELFVTTSESIALNPTTSLWTDVRTFKKLAREGLSDPIQVNRLIAAADLYRGDLMDGFHLDDCPEFDEWQFFQREESRQILAQVLAHLVEEYTNQEEFQEALFHARRWLTLDSLSEPVHRRLMELYARTGQQAIALRQYAECERLLRHELDISPTRETTALYQAIRTKRFPAADEAHGGAMVQETAETSVFISSAVSASPPLTIKHNLPVHATPFVGRTQDVAEISRRLHDSDCRLLTLIGPGGIGKTRLALRVAQQLIDEQSPTNETLFRDGIFFIALQPFTEATEIVAAIAEELDLRFYGESSPIDQLLEHLQAKDILLVMDNFEHLLEGAPMMLELLVGAPKIKILITSREALKLREEWLYPIAGMQLPPLSMSAPAIQSSNHATVAFPEKSTQEQLRYTTFDAIEFFIQTARRMVVAFQPDAHLAAIIRICRLVDGMPLAIELAAAWLKILSCERIAGEIVKSLDFLTSQHDNVPIRHRSVRAVFEQTWQQLEPEQQLVLSKLSVFQGGWTREAAKTVTDGSLFILMALVDKALIDHNIASPEADEQEHRYSSHPLVQQYVAEKLAMSTELLAQTRLRHADYYLQLAESQIDRLRGTERTRALRFFDAELANIRTAWQWIVEQQEWSRLSQIALSLLVFWEEHAVEGERLFVQTADRLDPENPNQAIAFSLILVGLAQLRFWLGMAIDPIETLLDRAIPLLRQQNAFDGLAKAFDILGNIVWLKGKHRRAKTILDEGLDLARTYGTQDGVSDLLIRKGLVERELGEVKEVITFYQKSLDELRAMGDLSNLAHQLLIYGEYLVVQDQIEQGQKYLEECWALTREIGTEHRFYAFLLIHLAIAAYKLNSWDESEAYLQEVLTLAKQSERTHPEALAHLFIGRCKVAQEQLLQAESHLIAGLSLGWTHDLTLVATLAIVCFAELYLGQGRTREAICLLTIALNHPATEKRDKQDADRHLSSLQEKTPTDIFDEAVRQSHTQSLEEAVEQILWNESRSPLLRDDERSRLLAGH